MYAGKFGSKSFAPSVFTNEISLQDMNTTTVPVVEEVGEAVEASEVEMGLVEDLGEEVAALVLVADRLAADWRVEEVVEEDFLMVVVATRVVKRRFVVLFFCLDSLIDHNDHLCLFSREEAISLWLPCQSSS